MYNSIHLPMYISSYPRIKTHSHWLGLVLCPGFDSGALVHRHILPQELARVATRHLHGFQLLVVLLGHQDRLLYKTPTLCTDESLHRFHLGLAPAFHCFPILWFDIFRQQCLQGGFDMIVPSLVVLSHHQTSDKVSRWDSRSETRGNRHSRAGTHLTTTPPPPHRWNPFDHYPTTPSALEPI